MEKEEEESPALLTKYDWATVGQMFALRWTNKGEESALLDAEGAHVLVLMSVKAD